MIGWYAHHHGAGHVQRAVTVIEHLRHPATLFSSRPHPRSRLLPLDVEAPRSHACAVARPSRSFHYAPLGVDGLRERMATMAQWVQTFDPSIVVVDVSVEVAGLMRLLSVPTVVVRQHGLRDDEVHRRCYDDAVALLAPFPEALEPETTPVEIAQRTIYTGGFSRFDRDPGELDVGDRRAAKALVGAPLDERLVVVLTGDEGAGSWPIRDAVDATPGWTWRVLGSSADAPAPLRLGWVEDPLPWLSAADVILTHAGHNAVMECAAVRRPFIVVPKARPFNEQRSKAEALQSAGIGMVRMTWPTASAWPGLLEEASRMDPDLGTTLVDGHGARRMARAVDDLADRWGRRADVSGPVPAAEVAV